MIVDNDSGLPANQPQLMRSHLDFPVVGIGASAGGLQALLRFFEQMPGSNGMAFVVILHLSPKHQSSADTVLARATSMPVVQVSSEVPIQADHVYVIAPNMQLSMSDGMLRVAAAERPRGQHVAIDVFFRTLADVHRERAIAVVLSGTGADGSVGVERIKEQGGITLVQEPADAEYEGMPLAAIGTGVVDFVLPVTEMAQRLVEIWASARNIQLPPVGDEDAPAGRPEHDHSASDEEALQEIISLLCVNTGHDFRHYKRATVLRRIERRLQVRSVTSLPGYAALLEQEPAEYKALLKDMLIGVTNFFRDRESFEALERDVLPLLFKGKVQGEQVRAWVAGCATGQEAYSLAMLLAEQAALVEKPPEVQLFATDIDEIAIGVARTGLFPTSIVTDVPPPRLRQYFSKEEGRYRIRKTVRDLILFAHHNLLRDPPFSRLDMISCRNLLIYLNRDMQLRVMEMFHSALKPDGFLFLGSSESAEAAAEFFVPFDKKNRIYRARVLSRAARYIPALPHASATRLPELVNAGSALTRQFTYADVHQRALSRFAPPSVVVDRDLNIVHMSESAGAFLRYIGGEPSRSLLALVLPELRLELRTAMYQAQQGNISVEGQRVLLHRGDRAFHVNMIVRPFNDEVANGNFILIVFEETEQSLNVELPGGAVPHKDLVLTQLEAELQRNKEKLQETIEHAEISNEELRASNEELQAINEELRSATEELETSKEELQSVNEELITVNYELKVKVEETGKANDDLNNLIASTDIATIFVDRGMRIERFTPRATDLFSIIPSDIGRSLFDITHKLDYEALADDVSTTFETLRLVEREVRSTSGRYYIARLLPYRTTEDKIEGAVMTFFDITGRREAEEKVRAGEAWMRLVAESTGDYAILTMDKDGRITGWNRGAEQNFGYAEGEVLGKPADFLFTPADREQGVPAAELRGARETGRAEDERWHVRKDGSRLFCQGVTTPLSNNGTLYGYAKIARDQTARVQHDDRREAALSSEQHGRSMAESASAMKDEFLAVMSHELRHPLNLIAINAELLVRLPELRQSPTAQRAAYVIRTSVTSQAKIIDDLLDMSRLSTGKLTLAREDVDLGDIAARLVDVLKADPLLEFLRLQFVQADHPLMVSADVVRMEQVVLNLLNNAVKFTPAGGTIALTLCADDGQARLDVSDTGAGIEPRFLPHIFDMFGQGGATAVRSKTGLGIGLALVRHIVELHGGRVEAGSDGVGQGSRFSIWLPLVQCDARCRDEQPDATGTALAGRRILLVDDMEDSAYMFRSLLETEGATVTAAITAREGLALLAQEQFDVLISDISMPDMDGYEFMRAVRAQPALASLPALAASGLGRAKDVQEALEAGFSGHITKPIDIDVLCRKISELLPP